MITTHSEHIVLGLLEAIMEKKLDANDLRIYYFEKENGITKSSKLQIDENGRVEEGLKGFFDVDMKHINRLLEVLKKSD
jgi:predicted ATPase